MVSDVHVEQLTNTSVRVSWRQVLAGEVAHYTVYYKPCEQSEQSVTVPSSESSLMIENLMTNMQYHILVVAVAELEGAVFPGERSSPIPIVVSLLSHPDTMTSSGS